MNHTALFLSPRRRGAVTAALVLVVALLLMGAPLAASADDPTTGSVSGVVLVSGTGVAGIDVVAFPAGGGIGVDAITDEFGGYTIAELPWGDYTVMAWADSSIYEIPGQVPVTLAAATPSVTVDFLLVRYPEGTATWTGTVVDSASGARIAGASILIGAFVSFNRHATSDAVGHFEFADLPAAEYHVNVSSPGYVWSFPEVSIGDGQALVRDLPLIASNSTIYGHLKLADGTPITDAWLDAHTTDGSGYGSANVDENGDYTIPDLGSGTYLVSVGGVGTPYVYKEKTVTAVANTSVKANFTLKKRTTGAIIGFVTDATTGAELEGFCVTVFKASKKVIVATGVSYADGTYTIDELAPGNYKVKFNDCDHTKPKYAKEFYGEVDNWQDATPITVAAGVDFYDGNISLDLKH